MGADASGFSRNRWLWWRLGHPFFFRSPFGGVDLRDIADEMEHYLGQEIRNIPRIKANLLFQYKRPELVTTKLGSEWGHWNQKYFRYDIYREQQALLAHIDAKFGSQALILYASPALVDVNDLVDAKINGRLIENTNFRKASELTGHHRNTFIKAGTHSIACSEPERFEPFDLLKNLEQLEDLQSSKNEEFMVRLAKGVRVAAGESSFIGNAYRRELQNYAEFDTERYRLFFSLISMSIFRDLSGIQWVLAVNDR